MAEASLLQSELAEEFRLAAEHVKSTLVSRLDPSQLLGLYALYKQATQGRCPPEKPRWYQLQEKQKWEAWSSLGDMEQSDAMSGYVRMVSELDPGWTSEQGQDRPSEGWVTVSCLSNTDEFIHDSDKTVFDWVKEGDVQRVRSAVLKEGVDVNAVDAEGMGLIHWAADRDNVDMLKMLVAELKADVNLQDQEGQTALHYAASCGHVSVVKYLVEQGADQTIADVYGMLPAHVASEEEMCHLFNPVKSSCQ
ncbi:hypothetical protein ONE63_008825 [Megalurothrips usitatus]|nr:hypothetical protein ONE63_008825 [Megalurothrips usitatus]